MTTLVLFDIDGTILLSDGAGRRAIQHALTEVFGGIGPSDHRFDGKTDRQIVRELMRHEGHDDPAIDARMDRLLHCYVERLQLELADGAYRARLLDGVAPLLDALEAREDVTLGLLTGNVVDGARAKLRAVGIDPDRFRIGAFGSDEEHRPDLPAVALRRVREAMGLDLAAEAMVVIGDTPADIDCGRAAGGRTVAVATGRYTIAELREHRPDFVFEDLTDTASLLRAIVPPGAA